MANIAARRVAFRKLHENFFILPNATNAGEARRLAELGFKAVASTTTACRSRSAGAI